MSDAAISARPIEGLPEIAPGDRLGRLIAERAAAASIGLDATTVLCVSQKVVSKAEGRLVALDGVAPGARALELARELDKDPRLVELILGESARVVRAEHGVLIVETRSGLVCANAGIDLSNVPGEEVACLLPEDPDRSARALRAELAAAAGPPPAVLIADSFGRPWRLGQAEVAIGCAGLAALDDRRGLADREGRELSATLVAVADHLAASAELVRHKSSGTPAVAIEGAGRWITAEDGPGAAVLRRPAEQDLFR